MSYIEDIEECLRRVDHVDRLICEIHESYKAVSGNKLKEIDLMYNLTKELGNIIQKLLETARSNRSNI